MAVAGLGGGSRSSSSCCCMVDVAVVLVGVEMMVRVMVYHHPKHSGSFEKKATKKHKRTKKYKLTLHHVVPVNFHRAVSTLKG